MQNLPPSLLLALGCALFAAPTALAQEDPYEIPMEEEDEGLSQEELDAKAEIIMPRVSKMRGWDWKKEVPVGITTPDEFIDFAEKAFDEEYGDVRMKGMTTSYGLLGLMDPELDFESTMMDMLRSQVGGYYDPKEGKFFMMSTFNKGGMADYIMAHELCHALDDQYFNLEAMFEDAAGSSDREFALRCAIEGSASSIGNLYLMEGIQKGWLDASSMMDMDMLASLGAMEAVPSYFIINMSLPYLDGACFVVRSTSDNIFAAMMTEPPDSDLQHMFRNPPVSSEQVLHPEKYWEEATYDAPIPVELEDRTAKLGAGWSLVDTDVMGELGCAAVSMKRVPNATEVSMGSARMNVDSSAGWGGDLYRTYLHEDGRSMMQWSTVWDSELDAQEFAVALREHGMKRAPWLRRIDLQGTRVMVFYASDDAIADLELL
ncbi:MAG: hypothetical protein ACPG31_11040 [Planctomycetota bacterium]